MGHDDARPVTRDRDRGIRAYLWAEDGRHLLYVQDEDGNENWRLYAVEAGEETGEARDLAPFDGVQARVVDKNKDLPGEILVGLSRRDPRVHDVYRLELATGELGLVAENPGDFAGWVADRDLRVRGALRSTPASTAT